MRIAVIMLALATAAPAAAQQVLKAGEAVALQDEPGTPEKGRYDWGPSVMKDGGLYKMWWCRLGGGRKKQYPGVATLPDGKRHEFRYPDWGDRIYYAESRDGVKWNISGDDFKGSFDKYGPDSEGPLMVLRPSETAQERYHVGCPSVIKIDGKYFMYYEASCEFKAKVGPDGKIGPIDEYHAQVFLAVSDDGKRWRKHPSETAEPIVPAPEENKKVGRLRYGLGQPSVCRYNGVFVMHYVDSCTGPGDFVVRLEAYNPYFRGAKKFRKSLRPGGGNVEVPEGSVARFAQMGVSYLGGTFFLVRPAYGTGNVGILATRDGLFHADNDETHPKNVFPQILAGDTRGAEYKTRHFPRFLTDPEGKILLRDRKAALFYGSGRGWKDQWWTWDLFRCEVPFEGIVRAFR